MSDTTLQVLQQIISEICDIDEAEIVPSANTIDDLGVDSLDFLDISFAVEQRLGVKLPAENWVEAVNQGNAEMGDYFTVDSIVKYIDTELAARNAAAA